MQHHAESAMGVAMGGARRDDAPGRQPVTTFNTTGNDDHALGHPARGRGGRGRRGVTRC